MLRMLAQRGIDVCCETILVWTVKFGPKIAANLRRRKLPPSPRRHLDEMVCTIGGEPVFLWCIGDNEGKVLDIVVQKRRDTRAALRLSRSLARKQPRRELTYADPKARAENLGFKSQASVRRFLTTHAKIYNAFDL